MSMALSAEPPRNPVVGDLWCKTTTVSTVDWIMGIRPQAELHVFAPKHGWKLVTQEDSEIQFEAQNDTTPTCNDHHVASTEAS